MSPLSTNVQEAAERYCLAILQKNVKDTADIFAEDLKVDINIKLNKNEPKHIAFSGRDQFITLAQKVADAIQHKFGYGFNYSVDEQQQGITITSTYDHLISSLKDQNLKRLKGTTVIQMSYLVGDNEKIIFTNYVTDENDTEIPLLSDKKVSKVVAQAAK